MDKINPGDPEECPYIPYIYTGAFTVSAPTNITISSNGFKPMVWSILDYDVWRNCHGLDQSKPYTYADYSVSFQGSHPGLALANYDGSGRADVAAESGYTFYWGISATNAEPGEYLVKIQASDSQVGLVHDSGTQTQYVGVTVN